MKRKEGVGEKKKAILVLFGLNWLCFSSEKTGGVDKDFWTIQNSKQTGVFREFLSRIEKISIAAMYQ